MIYFGSQIWPSSKTQFCKYPCDFVVIWVSHTYYLTITLLSYLLPYLPNKGTTKSFLASLQFVLLDFPRSYTVTTWLCVVAATFWHHWDPVLQGLTRWSHHSLTWSQLSTAVFRSCQDLARIQKDIICTVQNGQIVFLTINSWNIFVSIQESVCTGSE